jgi:hypothetical protein
MNVETRRLQLGKAAVAGFDRRGWEKNSEVSWRLFPAVAPRYGLGKCGRIFVARRHRTV